MKLEFLYYVYGSVYYVLFDTNVVTLNLLIYWYSIEYYMIYVSHKLNYYDDINQKFQN